VTGRRRQETQGATDGVSAHATRRLHIRLSDRDCDTLRDRIGRGLARAERSGKEVLVALTIVLGDRLDPAAVVFASKRPMEPWFCFEQAESGRVTLGALGCVATLAGHGAQRFSVAEAQWRELLSTSICDPADGGGGLVAVGGFAFSPYGGMSPEWSRFDPLSMHVPEVTIVQDAARTRLTLAAMIRPGDTLEGHLRRSETRLDELRWSALPDQDISSRPEVVSVHPPNHHRLAVETAVNHIDKHALRKVVLARAVDVSRSEPHSPAAVYGALRSRFPSCYVFCVGRGASAFLAASPELLVQRDGPSVRTVALAGSAPRGGDARADAQLGRELLASSKNRQEQDLVRQWIIRALKAHSLWVSARAEPVLARVANAQHLATPVSAQLAEPIGALRLAGLLHPTPAVGGEPLDVAEGLIGSLEDLDRGWYAGGVGWIDGNEDGEFVVSLRSALLAGTVARCFAGAGVVGDSRAAAEFDETEFKLDALLQALGASMRPAPVRD
jgi:salicylate biosynthesis isochorismate synthase